MKSQHVAPQGPGVGITPVVAVAAGGGDGCVGWLTTVGVHIGEDEGLVYIHNKYPLRFC